MTVLKAKIGGTFQSVLSGYASNVYIGPDPPADPNVQFWVDSDATLPVVPWNVLTLASGWINLAGGWTAGSYRKIDDIVYLRGTLNYAASLGSGSNIVATLPSGFRPALGVMFPCMYNNNNTTMRVDVNSSGQIVLQTVATGSVGYLSLDPIRFSITA